MLSTLELQQLTTELKAFRVTKTHGDKSFTFVDREAWLQSKGALDKWGRVILPKDPQAKCKYAIFSDIFEQWVEWDRKRKVQQAKQQDALFKGIAESAPTEIKKDTPEEDLLKEALENF